MSDYQIYRLKNGIRCIHHYSTSAVAQLSITIGAGTRDELDKQHGVAHLVEHLLFKGTSTRSAYRINSILESVGGELNAFTSKEETVLHASAPASVTVRGVELLCDIAFNSLFKQEEVDKEREVIIDEINSYKDSPSELIYDDFEELMYAGAPLGRNILGSKSNLRGIKSADLINFTRTNYQASRVVFALSSPLSGAKFEALCDRIFGSLSFDTTSSQLREKPVPLDSFEVIRNKKLHQVHVLLGGYTYCAYDEKRLDLAFLLNILAGPTSISRLNQLLREKYALTYSVEATYSIFVDTGLWTIYYSSESQKRERAYGLIMKELKRMCDTPFTKVQLDRYKRQFVGQLIMGSENRENTMLSIAKSILLYDDFEENNVIADKVNAITAESLCQVANETFKQSNISKLIYV